MNKAREKNMNMNELILEIEIEQIQKDRQKKLKLAQEIEYWSSIDHRENTSENYFLGNYDKGIIRQQQ
tara:strand:- start:314 stop:517 length:204 start_codon:yes stop_codon:yes gene_type:complete